jgi:LuxR family maltose regulon positive regulatory protein
MASPEDQCDPERVAHVVDPAPPGARRAGWPGALTVTAPRFRSAIPLVEAKLHPPPPHPGTVARTRLLDLLETEPGPRVVSVIAPPGYGKTTFLAGWAALERRPVAWLTLDDLDNDPAVLLSYLAVAFDRIEPIDPSIQTALAAPRQRILATALPRLASELHGWPQPAVLILDDVHRLADRMSLDVLAALLDHLPPGFRVAIAGRTEPDLPLARLRAQRDLLEIGPTLLALDETEAEALVAAAGHKLKPDEVRALTIRTEGWAAGIYLTALARKGGDVDPGTNGRVTGSDRYISAYLRSEFARDLDDDNVTFLTRTAILETVAPPVAEAVCGLTGAAERLRSLARGNLLIREVGVVGPSFRYHNLLRDYLLAELERREPGATPALHRRAAAWYTAAGNIDLAVEHAFAGGDMDVAARIVTAATMATYNDGHVATLDRWLLHFGQRDFEGHPPLAVMAGWIHLLNGRADDTDRMAGIAERATFHGPPGDGSTSYESALAMLRAVMGRHGPKDVLANAELAASQEQPGSPWRPVALWLLGSAYLITGDADGAEMAFQGSAAGGLSAGMSVMTAEAKRASIAMARGDWRAAEGHAQHAREHLQAAHFDETVASLIVYAVGARVAIHRGDLARGGEDLVRAQLVRPLATHAVPWFSVDALLELARAYLAIADVAGAQAVVREAEQIVRQRPDLGTLTTDLIDIRRRLAGTAATLAGSSTLTGAELRLLPFLPTYLSFQEIGERLFISRHTVKTQAMSIYGKLQASSRGEAVERAIELGLLEPFHGLRLARRTPAD